MAFDIESLPQPVKESFSKANVLITGGLGFLGSNLAMALVDLDAKVTLLDGLQPLYGGNYFNIHGYQDKVTVVEGDIRDSELMSKLVKGQNYIFNFAAQVSYIDSKEQPFLDLDINGRGHLTCLEAIREHAPKAKVLFSSSRMVYGKILTVPVAEDHPTEPLSLYGIHKLLGEKYYHYYADTFGLHTVSIRIPNPYGPGQQMKHNKYSIVGWFVRQAMENQTIKIFGDGSQERDYLYIDDIVEACLRLAVQAPSGQVYNIGTHERIRFIDMVDAVLREVGQGAKEMVPWPEHYERNETGNYIADTTKIQSLTGWQPKISLVDGIKRMVDYYKEYQDKYW